MGSLGRGLALCFAPVDCTSPCRCWCANFRATFVQDFASPKRGPARPPIKTPATDPRRFPNLPPPSLPPGSALRAPKHESCARGSINRRCGQPAGCWPSTARRLRRAGTSEAVSGGCGRRAVILSTASAKCQGARVKGRGLTRDVYFACRWNASPPRQPQQQQPTAPLDTVARRAPGLTCVVSFAASAAAAAASARSFRSRHVSGTAVEVGGRRSVNVASSHAGSPEKRRQGRLRLRCARALLSRKGRAGRADGPEGAQPVARCRTVGRSGGRPVGSGGGGGSVGPKVGWSGGRVGWSGGRVVGRTVGRSLGSAWRPWDVMPGGAGNTERCSSTSTASRASSPMSPKAATPVAKLLQGFPGSPESTNSGQHWPKLWRLWPKFRRILARMQRAIVVEAHQSWFEQPHLIPHSCAKTRTTMCRGGGWGGGETHRATHRQSFGAMPSNGKGNVTLGMPAKMTHYFCSAPDARKKMSLGSTAPCG